MGGATHFFGPGLQLLWVSHLECPALSYSPVPHRIVPSGHIWYFTGLKQFSVVDGFHACRRRGSPSQDCLVELPGSLDQPPHNAITEPRTQLSFSLTEASPGATVKKITALHATGTVVLPK